MVGTELVRRRRAAFAVCVLLGLAIGSAALCATRYTYYTHFELATGWNLWALTLIPENPDPVAVFEGMPLDERLYRWDGAAREYVPYQDNDPARFGPLVTGHGYWVFSDRYRGDMGYLATAAPEPRLSLPEPGWHLLGCPVYMHRVLQIMVVDSQSGTSVQIDQAGALGWTDPVLWRYIPRHGYYLLYIWDAGDGAWLYTHRPDLQLEFPVASGWI